MMFNQNPKGWFLPGSLVPSRPILPLVYESMALPTYISPWA
jgi:hypothetical protein